METLAVVELDFRKSIAEARDILDAGFSGIKPLSVKTEFSVSFHENSPCRIAIWISAN